MKNPKLAIVTGGSSGIGLAITQLLADKYSVINADITAPEKPQPDNVMHIHCDITKAEDIDKLSGTIQDQKKKPDVLVLNAGRGIHEKIREGDPEKWMEIINLNIMGTLRTLRAVLPFMDKGDIIFISSVSAGKAFPYGGIYAATKTAINIIAETLRLEEQPDIRVSVISAGVVNTSFFKKMGSHSIEDIGWGAIEPSELAEAVTFILETKNSASINNIVIRPSGQIL